MNEMRQHILALRRCRPQIVQNRNKIFLTQVEQNLYDIFLAKVE